MNVNHVIVVLQRKNINHIWGGDFIETAFLLIVKKIK